MIRVTRYAYTGLEMPAREFYTMAEAREYVAGLIRDARADGFPVAVLDPGSDWEVQEPEGLHMVPDDCGTISLRETFAHECPECGSGYDDAEDAARCCGAEYDDTDPTEARERAAEDEYLERADWDTEV